MHYSVDNKIIKTDITAKSIKQQSQYLVDYIKNMEPVEYCLDYGCGKLRYSLELLKKSAHLTLVDSEIQLKKRQRINGELTTVYDYAQHRLMNTEALNIVEFSNSDTSYDFILCANVLSAIPCKNTHNRILENIKCKLKKNGKCLIVNQYTNSFYSKIAKDKNSTKHLYGFIRSKNNTHTYFGQLYGENIVSLLKPFSFEMIKVWNTGQSNYALFSN